MSLGLCLVDGAHETALSRTTSELVAAPGSSRAGAIEINPKYFQTTFYFAQWLNGGPVLHPVQLPQHW
jgi:hypothetical protein